MNLIQTNVPLSSLTSMKVGGSADYFADLKTKEEFLKAFEFAQEHKLPIVYLGQGSNMIVPEKGFRALVIRLMNDDTQIDQEYSDDEALITVGAAKVLAKLIRDCRKEGLSGLDNFVGIPGVLGAAIAGNIGIPEEEIGSLVHSVEIFDGTDFCTLSPEECRFRYRGSVVRDNHWLVRSVKLLIRKGDTAHKDEWLLERVSKQPKGNSCGSFFRNPDPENNLYAGKLIEECGLKGKRVGGAFISEKHANFLMNDGSATADDVLELAKLVKHEVFDRKGIELENEVLIYGEDGGLMSI